MEHFLFDPHLLASDKFSYDPFLFFFLPGHPIHSFEENAPSNSPRTRHPFPASHLNSIYTNPVPLIRFNAGIYQVPQKYSMEDHPYFHPHQHHNQAPPNHNHHHLQNGLFVDKRMKNGLEAISGGGAVSDRRNNGGLPSSKRKRSWSRAVFSNLQRKGLEIAFGGQKYITKPDRRKLAARLGLTDAQVKVWFQNRRMKWRHTGEDRKLGTVPPGNKNYKGKTAAAEEMSTSSDDEDSDADEIDVID